MSVEKNVQRLIDGFKEFGVDLIQQIKDAGIDSDEKVIRKTLGVLFFDEEAFRKIHGVGYKEYCLMRDGLNLEEAHYVMAHPCIHDAEKDCSYHKEHGKCALFGCTYLNGWLYYKTGPGKKPRPIPDNMPKDILYINEKDVGDAKILDDKIEGFLDYCQLRDQQKSGSRQNSNKTK